MSTIVYDTLKLAEGFRNSGFTEQQAKSLANGLGTLANDHMVTREYLDFKLREVQLRLTVSLGGLMAGIIAFFKVMDKFL